MTRRGRVRNDGREQGYRGEEGEVAQRDKSAEEMEMRVRAGIVRVR